jgi:hypothetical protein
MVGRVYSYYIRKVFSHTRRAIEWYVPSFQIIILFDYTLNFFFKFLFRSSDNNWILLMMFIENIILRIYSNTYLRTSLIDLPNPCPISCPKINPNVANHVLVGYPEWKIGCNWIPNGMFMLFC